MPLSIWLQSLPEVSIGQRGAAEKVGKAMTLQAHYAMVQEKHVKLEGMIEVELHRPLPDISMLQTLKKQKLLLKEELERIRSLERQRLDAA